MTPEDIKLHLHQHPFKPFRIHLSDGRTFDIRHPDFAWVLRSRIEVGLSDDPQSTVPDRAEFVSLLHIVSIEELQAA
jgi:hypothetical protein